jgi:hypothetical protein
MSKIDSLTKKLLGYSLAVAVLLPLAIQNDSEIYSYTFRETFNAPPFLKSFLLILIVYLVRIFILIRPRAKGKSYAPGWLRGGIAMSFLPELILVLGIIGNSFAPESDCNVSGWISSCGWGSLLYLVIAMSCIAQIFGMLTGGLISKLRNK